MAENGRSPDGDGDRAEEEKVKLLWGRVQRSGTLSQLVVRNLRVLFSMNGACKNSRLDSAVRGGSNFAA